MQQSSVLIVEDDRDIRESLKQFLELEGYDVTVAWNGKEALKVLSSIARPSVVLLDLMMPVMNGWDFLGEFRKDSRWTGVPVIVISAAGNLGQLGAVQGVLKKPIDLDALLGLVKQHANH